MVYRTKATGDMAIIQIRRDVTFPPSATPLFSLHFYYSVVSETKLVTDGKNISTANF